MNISQIVGHSTWEEAADLMRECIMALPSEITLQVINEMLTKHEIAELAEIAGVAE